jgi:NAD+--dinitrogen-reductase ADP-D-ribosyltransferase
VVAGDRRDRAVLRLNNVVSFSTSRERAGGVGDWILEARVPVVRSCSFPACYRAPRPVKARCW